MGQAMMRGLVGRRPEGSHISTTRAMYLETPRQVRVDSFNGFGGMDFRDQLPAVDVRAAVLVGSRDVLTPVRLGRSIARRIPGATLEVLPDAGHILPLERPAEIIAAIGRLA
jgi:pimeloyl-ACP methyl ester carboxylesterase